MKKIILNEYGDVDVMQMVDVPEPTPNDNQILIKTVAIGVNDPDVTIRQHGPFPTMPEAMKPKLPHSLGQDFSGVVVGVGKNVSKFAVGDAVVGLAFMNTYSEYIILNETDTVAVVPKNLDLVPLGGFYLSVATAWASTITDGQVQKGHKVLIHGGAGGIGSMAIQLAKNAGAYVIATGSAQHAEYMKSLGADEIIDYKTQDFTQLVSEIDLVVNLTGQATLDKSYQVIKKGGRLTSVNGMPDFEKSDSLGISSKYSMGFMSAEDLQKAIDLYAQHQLTVFVNATYPFELPAIKQAQLDFQHGSNVGRRIIVFKHE